MRLMTHKKTQTISKSQINIFYLLLFMYLSYTDWPIYLSFTAYTFFYVPLA